MAKLAGDTVPLGDELDALVRHYHHLQQAHQQEPPGGSTRRHVEEKLLDTRARIDRLLEAWVPDEDVRQQWRDYLEHHAPRPSEPEALRPLLFRGVNDAGSTAVVRRARDGSLAVEVDGKLDERVVAERDLAATVPPLRLRLDSRRSFTETFEASEAALAELERFLESGGPPPWDHVSELLADGEIDSNVGATARGRRALAARS